MQEEQMNTIREALKCIVELAPGLRLEVDHVYRKVEGLGVFCEPALARRETSRLVSETKAERNELTGCCDYILEHRAAILENISVRRRITAAGSMDMLDRLRNFLDGVHDLVYGEPYTHTDFNDVVGDVELTLYKDIEREENPQHIDRGYELFPQEVAKAASVLLSFLSDVLQGSEQTHTFDELESSPLLLTPLTAPVKELRELIAQLPVDEYARGDVDAALREVEACLEHNCPLAAIALSGRSLERAMKFALELGNITYNDSRDGLQVLFERLKSAANRKTLPQILEAAVLADETTFSFLVIQKYRNACAHSRSDPFFPSAEHLNIVISSLSLFWRNVAMALDGQPEDRSENT